jgi:hypothetical protein
MWSKSREWIGRYGWAEFWGVITSYLGYYITHQATTSSIAASFGASFGENIGYYGCILWREISARRDAGEGWTSRTFGALTRDLLYEFGLAELLDFLIVRPGVTFLAVAMFGSAVGVAVGKVAADIVFYALAIGFYERRKARANSG